MRSFYDAGEETKQWCNLLNGDQEALAFFYTKYTDWLLRYGLSLTCNRELVQDAIQELFINIWNRRQNLSQPDSVKYYLMVSIRRIILKDIKNSRLSTDLSADEALCYKYGEDVSIEEDLYAQLQNAVRSLPPRQQEVIFLKFFEKLSYEQITAITGLDYQILRNTIYRAIKSLRGQLAEKTVLLVATLLTYLPDIQAFI
jgi:RNA polymerase sigma factor (sigma-70 family)